MKYIYRFYWRLNAVLGYLVLTPLDYMITKTTDKKWSELHKDTMEVVKRLWYKY